MPPTKPKKKAPSHLATKKVRRLRGVQSNINDLKLMGAKWSTRLHEPTDAKLTRTIEGASTVAITMHDEDAALIRSKLMESRLDIELDGLWFRSVRLEKIGRLYTLTFEDREVALMRRVEEPTKAFRDQVTRAEFVYSQVQEAWKLRGGYEFPVYIPKLHKVRPIANEQDAAAYQIQLNAGDLKGDKGLDQSENFTVKGAAASPEQLQQVEIILGVGSKLNAPEAAMVAAVVAPIGESGLDPNAVNPSSSATGVFQELPSTSAALNINPHDTAAGAHVFFTKGFGSGGGAIELANQGKSPVEIALIVEAGGVDAYSPWLGEAEKFVASFQGGAPPAGISGSVTFDVAKQYAFERKPGEDAWDSTGRLADEVQFRRFVSAGVFYYLAETQLLTQKPMMYIDGDTRGVDDIDFGHDHGQPTQEITITARAPAWSAGPATLIKLNEDWGPAHGRYVISQIESNLYNDQVTIMAKKPMTPLPEPAPEQTSKTVSFGESGTMGVGGATGSLRGVQIRSTAPGDPHWGGSADVMHQFVDAFMAKHGIQPGARKEEGHAVGGDHDPSVTNAYATDYPCADVESSTQCATSLVAALGGPSGIIGTFTKFNITVDGETFGCQVLWHVPDHYDHIHVGIRHGGY